MGQKNHAFLYIPTIFKKQHFLCQFYVTFFLHFIILFCIRHNFKLKKINKSAITIVNIITNKK